MKKIILATTSPYRKAAFSMLGIDFEAEGSQVDEQFDGRPESPEELVMQLAKLKAEAVAKNHTDGVVIGFDSIGWFNGEVLEKNLNQDKKLSTGSNRFRATAISSIRAFISLMFLTARLSEQRSKPTSK